MLNVTGTTFIRNAFDGGFPLFESMATVLSLVDSFILVDMGSTDGTLETCQEIAKHNNRITIHQHKWSNPNDASAFADVANDCVNLCPTENVTYYQADEIFHQKLIRDMREQYQNGIYEMTFERIQLSRGWQVIKWLPHCVCRSLKKGKRTFVGDGMSVGDTGGCLHMCPFPTVDWHEFSGRPHHGRAFPWHQPQPGLEFSGNDPKALNRVMAEVFPWESFLFDTSSCFRDSQVSKKALHAPFWRENPNIIDGKHKTVWQAEADADCDWMADSCPFPLPKICEGLVGMTKYSLRDNVRLALMKDNYGEFDL